MGAGVGETVKCIGVGNVNVRGWVGAENIDAAEGLSASVGGVGGSGSGVVRTGRGRKVHAKVGGASEGRGREKGGEEKVLGEKDDDKGKEEDKDIRREREKESSRMHEGEKTKEAIDLFNLDPPRHRGPDEWKQVQEPGHDDASLPSLPPNNHLIQSTPSTQT